MSEKVEVAKNMMPLLVKEAKERQVESRANQGEKIGTKVKVLGPEPCNKGQASDQAAKLVGISGATIRRTEYVERHGTSELVEAVDKGEISVREEFYNA